MRIHSILLAFLAGLLLTAAANPASALDVFVNGVKVSGLKNADLANCQVKFDAEGNIHVISPGYTVAADKDGVPKLSGQSDLAGPRQAAGGKLKMRYVLMYQPNPRVNFSFDVYVNGKLFRKIGLEQGPFGVELTQDMRVGANTLRVVGNPGTAPPGGAEVDIATLKILKGEERADGAFVAKPPSIWELVRAAIDRNPLDRSYNVTAE